MAEGIKEKARLMHAHFFGDCKRAIEEGYYLEAMFLEYASIEDRVNVTICDKIVIFFFCVVY